MLRELFFDEGLAKLISATLPIGADRVAFRFNGEEDGQGVLLVAGINYVGAGADVQAMSHAIIEVSPVHGPPGPFSGDFSLKGAPIKVVLEENTDKPYTYVAMWAVPANGPKRLMQGKFSGLMPELTYRATTQIINPNILFRTLKAVCQNNDELNTDGALNYFILENAPQEKGGIIRLVSRGLNDDADGFPQAILGKSECRHNFRSTFYSAYVPAMAQAFSGLSQLELALDEGILQISARPQGMMPGFRYMLAAEPLPIEIPQPINIARRALEGL